MLDSCTIALSSTTIRVMDRDGVSVFEVSGDIDMLSGAQMLAMMNTQLDARPAGFVVDLTKTAFFCSAGINALVAAATRAQEHEVLMVVVAGHSVVLRPLRITGVDEMLTIRPTLDEALAALGTDRVSSPNG